MRKEAKRLRQRQKVKEQRLRVPAGLRDAHEHSQELADRRRRSEDFRTGAGDLRLHLPPAAVTRR